MLFDAYDNYRALRNEFRSRYGEAETLSFHTMDIIIKGIQRTMGIMECREEEWYTDLFQNAFLVINDYYDCHDNLVLSIYCYQAPWGTQEYLIAIPDSDSSLRPVRLYQV